MVLTNTVPVTDTVTVTVTRLMETLTRISNKSLVTMYGSLLQGSAVKREAITSEGKKREILFFMSPDEQDKLIVEIFSKGGEKKC